MVTVSPATSSGGVSFRHNNFDLLRLFAASQVAFWHVAMNLQVELRGVLRWLGEFLMYFPGVPIFFVISGFLISASLDRNPNLREYALNRILRIYPALWVATLVTLGALVVFGDRVWTAIAQQGASQVRILATWLAAQISFAQFYNPHELKTNYGVGHLNGSLWTIPVELAFYVVLPLFAVLLWRGLSPRQQNVRLFAALAVAYAASLLYQRHVGDLRETSEDAARLVTVSLVPYLYMFLIGIMLQRNLQSIRRFVVGKGPWWLVAYLVTAYVFHRYLGTAVATSTPQILLMTLLAFATISMAFTAPHVSELLLRGNDISYGTYVYHMIVANLAFELGYRGTTTSWFVVLVITFVIATLSWLLVERPALRLKRHPLLSRSSDSG